MSLQGWVKIYRQLLDNVIVSKPRYLSLWVILLLKATHKEVEFIWNNKKCILKPGQLVTGRIELSKVSGIPESTVEYILEYFENEQQIEQQKTNKFRIITIKNWEKYQDKQTGEQLIGQQIDNRLTTDGHIQECKEGYKNVNKFEGKKYEKHRNSRRDLRQTPASVYGESIES